MRIGALAIIFFSGLALFSCSRPDREQSQGDQVEVSKDVSSTADETAIAQSKSRPAPPSKADDFDWPEATAHARISTNLGDFSVELYGNQAPASVENFLQYAREGQYDRTLVHRVVPGFVIQGGGYSTLFTERPTRDPIPYEGDNGLKNYRGAIAMARTSRPDSAAAQWFVNLRDNERLDHAEDDLGVHYGYAVFGRVMEGMDVVDVIGAVQTGPAGPFDAEVPVERVIIERVALTDAEADPE